MSYQTFLIRVPVLFFEFLSSLCSYMVKCEQQNILQPNGLLSESVTYKP